MLKKLISILFILCIITVSLFAESYVIRSYDFDISGKTQAWVLRNLIVPKSEEKFSSKEELVSALNSKKQTLDNKRVFKSVGYTLSEEVSGDVVYVDVLFTIDDAHTFLMLPYPKYDSNYGMKLGLKYYESNLMGTLSNLYGVTNVVFEPWDFKDADYYTEFNLNNLLIGEASVSAVFSGNLNPEEKDLDYKANLKVSNIVLAKGYSMNLAFGFENTGSELKYSGSGSLTGLKLKDVSFVPSISALIYEKTQASSYITPVLTTSNIRISNMKIDLSETVKFMNSKKFALSEAVHTTSIAFVDGALTKYGYSNTITYTPKSTIKLNNTISYTLSDSSTLHFYENIIWDVNKAYFSTFDSGIGISQKIKIGEYISITPTLKEFLTTSFVKGDIEPKFSRYYVISGSTSGNYINWKGDFRDGISYSLSISEAWTQEYTSRKAKDTILDRFELSLFKVVWGWLNPSARIIVNYTNNVSEKGAINGSDDAVLGEYLRGVRDQTIKDDGRNKNIITVVGNFNLMSKFPLPSIMSSFMNAYLNIFVDYAFTKHGVATDEANQAKEYLGFGFEGIGILKEYPSYPVRLSLGFDARKLVEYIKGESGERDFYEIYFGLDFFF